MAEREFVPNGQVEYECVKAWGPAMGHVISTRVTDARITPKRITTRAHYKWERPSLRDLSGSSNYHFHVLRWRVAGSDWVPATRTEGRADA